jgi:hypothetical protein
MKFMYTWSAKEGAIPEIVKRFLAGDATPPEGVTHLGRWHNVDLSGGFTLVETNDLVLLYKHVGRWATVLEFEVFPVIEDQEAAPVLKEVFGK